MDKLLLTGKNMQNRSFIKNEGRNSAAKDHVGSNFNDFSLYIIILSPHLSDP